MKIPNPNDLILQLIALLFLAFFGELGVMLAIDTLQLKTPLLEALLDASVLTFVLMLFGFAIRRYVVSVRTLTRHEALFRSIYSNAPIGIAVAQTDGAIKDANPLLMQMLGYSMKELRDRGWTGITHPDDVSTNRQLAIEVAQGKRSGYHIEKRYLHKNGTVIWADLHVSSVLDEDGRVEYLVAMVSDITPRKEVERQQQLAAAVFLNAAEAMMVTNANESIIAVNPAFTRITGYSEEEALGQRPNILSSGRHDRLYFQQMRNALLETGAWHGEIWNRRKDGGLYVQSMNISTIRDGTGRPINFIAVFNDVTGAHRRADEMLYRATHDPLTGLPNRALLDDRLDQSIALAARQSLGLAVMFVDLDGFKDVNDSLGHLAGDALLQGLATRFRGLLRSSDTVARYGGDEFVVVAVDVQGRQEAEHLAENILNATTTPLRFNSQQLLVGASIGIALYPEWKSASHLLQAADQAMYAAKRSGKSCWRIARPDSPSCESD